MRRLSFERACAQYLNRYTCEHVPAWAREAHITSDGRRVFYAPHFRTDREWYENTIFPKEPEHHGMGSDCYTNGQTWPLGKGFLREPFHKNRNQKAFSLEPVQVAS